MFSSQPAFRNLSASVLPLSLFAYPISRLKELKKFCLKRAGRRNFVVSPHDLQRQAHKDRLNPPECLEAEHGAAVVEQVELDISSATDQLPPALLVAERLFLPALNNGDVGA